MEHSVGDKVPFTLQPWQERAAAGDDGEGPISDTMQTIDHALLARLQKQAWFHRYPRGWPVLLFMMTALGTCASVVAIERADRQARAADLDRNAAEIASGLERRAAENVAQLRAAAAILASRPEVLTREFDEFASSAFEPGVDRGAVGTGWAPFIAASEIPALEARQRAEGYPGFTVWPKPASSSAIVAPVIDVVPRTNVTRYSLGFDMLSQPSRRSAIEQAIRLGHPVSTSRLTMLAPGPHGARVGFVIYMPVMHVRNGRRTVAGLVYSPFRADDFLDSAAELYRNRNVELAVYDGRPTPDSLLATRSSPGDTGASIDRRIEIAGRDWTLRVSSKRPDVLTTLSWATITFGLIAALLVMLTARIITRRAVDDRNLLEWMTRQATIRTQLTRELNHRVKNTLANVLSIVALTRRRSSNLDDFAEGLTARLRALSATHDILSQSDWTEAAIGEIVRTELAPYIEAGEGHIEIDGPTVSLAPNDALSLGLALHELATNAAKYGALSVPGGSIVVDWRLVGENLAEVHWRERGGPPVTPPSRRGFGLDLIEKVVSHELRTKVGLDFAPEGVECILQIPVRRPGEFKLRQ